MMKMQYHCSLTHQYPPTFETRKKIIDTISQIILLYLEAKKCNRIKF